MTNYQTGPDVSKAAKGISSGAFAISKIVVFSIEGQDKNKKLDYGLSIDQVQEIATLEQVTRVPGAPSHVRGVMNLRGKIITIVEMGKLLGFDRSPDEKAKPIDQSGSNCRIIVGQVKNSTFGMVVDKVDQVIEISQSNVEPAPAILADTAPYIKGIAKMKDTLYVLLDLRLLLEKESKQNNPGESALLNDFAASNISFENDGQIGEVKH